MWLAVTRRFQEFHDGLLLTKNQIDDGIGKAINIGKALEVAYNGTSTDAPPVFLVGSWGKTTQVRPSDDIDIMAKFDMSILDRFQNRVGNKQSQLLQEVRGHLSNRYPQTDIRGDGQVVVIGFNDITAEIVPVFPLADGKFLMPDTNDGGRWRTVNPQAQIDYVSAVDHETNGNARRLIRMIKMWRRHHQVNVKSFLLELLVCEFLQQYAFGRLSYYFFDWFVRDYFIYMSRRAWGTIVIPGTTDIVALGGDWVPRVNAAINNAEIACDWERGDYDVSAGQEWQKIFGLRIGTKIL